MCYPYKQKIRKIYLILEFKKIKFQPQTAIFEELSFFMNGIIIPILKKFIRLYPFSLMSFFFFYILKKCRSPPFLSFFISKRKEKPNEKRLQKIHVQTSKKQ